MVNDILIGSYYKDAEWLKYCLRSVRKFCKGFRQVIVIIPEGQKPAFSECDFTGCKLIERKGWVDCRPEHDCQPGHGAGFFQHVWDVMNADNYSDADFITHMDSDCVFTKETSPEHYFEDGKPLLWFRRYIKEEADTAMCWLPVVQHMLGYSVAFETMIIFPMTYPRAVYSECRQWMERYHQKTLEQCLMEIYRTNPRTRFVVDFSTIGAHVLRFMLHTVTAKYAPKGIPEKYYFNRIHNWSFGGITPEIRDKLEEIFK
jgi:hypothetical protein